MVRQMERSTVHVMAKRGRSIRQIAAELGRSPTTIARVLHDPVDKPPTRRRRTSQVDGYRAQIEHGIAAGLSNVRLLEQARADPEQPFRGGRTIFDDLVRQIRREVAHQQAARDVPIRFEGLPAE
jgi:predicted transcriptional regulator